MKKTFYAVFVLIIIAVVQSCDKHVNRENRAVTIDTTLASGQVYELNLSQYGDADDVANIIKQGTAYTTSAITNTSGPFAPVYTYSASSAKSMATDQVVLAITEGGMNGNSNHRKSLDSTIITINFIVK